MTAFQQALKAAFDSASLAAGLQAQYKRDDICITLWVVPGSSEHEASDAAGYLATYRQSDFLIKADDLDYHGERLRPEPGDQLIVGSRTYDVVTLPGESVPYRPADSHRALLRVHVALVEDTNL